MVWGGIQKTSTLDFPKVLSCVLFTVGCDLNCFYCHNRQLIGTSSQIVEEKEVFAFLDKRRNLLDGVVISGGEPTLQSDLINFLQKVRSMGFKIKIDTNGQHPDVVENILSKNLADYFAVDIKALPKDYSLVCGASGFENVKSTIEILSKNGATYEVRTTLYPAMKIEQLSELFSTFPKQQLWRLNFFKMPEDFQQKDLTLLNEPALTKNDICKNLDTLKAIQPNLVF